MVFNFNYTKKLLVFGFDNKNNYHEKTLYVKIILYLKKELEFVWIPLITKN